MTEPVTLEQKKAVPQAPTPAPVAETERKYKLTIHATPEGDKSAVFVSVNDNPVLIKRGVEVTVKESVVKALQDAVVDTVTKDPETGKETPVKYHRYPFTAMPI